MIYFDTDVAIDLLHGQFQLENLMKTLGPHAVRKKKQKRVKRL